MTDVKKPGGSAGPGGKGGRAAPVFSWGADRLGGLLEYFMREDNDA